MLRRRNVLSQLFVCLFKFVLLLAHKVKAKYWCENLMWHSKKPPKRPKYQAHGMNMIVMYDGSSASLALLIIRF